MISSNETLIKLKIGIRVGVGIFHLDENKKLVRPVPLKHYSCAYPLECSEMSELNCKKVWVAKG